MDDQHWSSHLPSNETRVNNRNGNNSCNDHYPISNNNNNQSSQINNNDNDTDHTESCDYLSEWEYLTTTYDIDDCIMDDHSLSSRTKPNDMYYPQNTIASANQHFPNRHQLHENHILVGPTLLSQQRQFDNVSHETTNASLPSQPSKSQNVTAIMPMMSTAQYSHNQTAFSHEISRSSTLNLTKDPVINYSNTINEHCIWRQHLPSLSSEQLLASSLTVNTTNYYNHFQPSQLNTIHAKVEASFKMTDPLYHNQPSHEELYEPSMSKIGKKVVPASYKRDNHADTIDDPFSELKRKADNHIAARGAKSFFETSTITSATRLSPSSTSGTGSAITSNVQHIKELPDTLRLFIKEQPELPPHQKHGNEKLLLKPLTPYNYYYREERDNIILHIIDEHDPLPLPVSDFSERKMLDLLYQRWYVDPMKTKRPHRKTHGKMGFQVLSKTIAKRWSQLPIEGKIFYRTISRYDDVFYREQLKMINGK